MVLSKRQILTLIFLLFLIFILPGIILLSKKAQDIRPRALQGKANLLLNASTTTPKAGDTFSVLISASLTDSNLKISGADFILLYDKTKVSVTNIEPAVTSSSLTPSFTDAVIVSKDGSFDAAQNQNFLRIAEVSTKGSADLSGGTVVLGKVTFKALSKGSAVIKFPDNGSNIQIVGIGNQ